MRIIFFFAEYSKRNGKLYLKKNIRIFYSHLSINLVDHRCDSHSKLNVKKLHNEKCYELLTAIVGEKIKKMKKIFEKTIRPRIDRSHRSRSAWSRN